MIFIQCKLKNSLINSKQLKENAQLLLDALNYSTFDLGILITTKKTIRHYNKQFRNIDKPTDILSFPYHSSLKSNQKIKVREEEDKNLGDLIICPAYVLENLALWDQSFEERITILLVHGICHLLGYDHVDEKDYKRMDRKEKKLLKVLNK